MQLLNIADLERPKSELAPLIEMATKLSDRYFDFLSSDSGGHQYKVSIGGGGARKPGIHASEISGCFRRLVYSISSVERKSDSKTADVNMKMRFGVGHAIHAMLQNDLGRMAEASNKELEFGSEVTINPWNSTVAAEWGIESSCDGVFTFLDKDEKPFMRVGLEIKSASDGEFEKIKEPKKDHSEQTCVYMACLNLPLMWTLYYNKSNSNITTSYPPFLSQFNKKLWEDLELRFVKAQHLKDVDKLPEREEGMPCRWCPFSWHCMPSILQAKPIQQKFISSSMYKR